MAPILAINIVIGIKIRNAGILTNPKLNDASVARYIPEIAKPKAPITETRKPIAAELPIAWFIEYPNIFNIGTLIEPPPIPIGAAKKPDKEPKTILCVIFILFCTWLVFFFDNKK